MRFSLKKFGHIKKNPYLCTLFSFLRNIFYKTNNTMKKLFLLCFSLVVAMTVLAVPARRGWQTRTQADGTTIEVQQFGDEFYHYMINRDGQQVRENENGMFEVVGAAPTAEQVKTRRAAAKERRAPKAKKAEGFGVTPYLPPKGVVIMVNYQDQTFKASTTKAVVDELCNSTNCTVNKYNGKNYGSIGQYFRDQSNGQYNIQLDIYGPVTLSKEYAYYGKDKNGEEGDDQYPGNAVIEACQLADDEIDFSQYDWNSDGEVDFVYIVYAGKGQADGGDANTIWPHSWEISSSRSYGYCTYKASQCVFDGKTVESYAMSNELSGTSLAGIGIICHEYGHVMGLPDFYDTDYGTNYSKELTPNEWDIMDGGSYNGDIHCPPNYDPWEKYFFGWETPENLGAEGRLLELKANGTDGYSCYQINSKGTQQTATTSGECYYIENRQQQGWDEFVPSHGMVIWKVNYNKTMWQNNAPNLSSNGDPHFTIVCSSGTKIGSSNGAGNVFPKGSINSWSGVSGKPLKDIKETNGVITLTYIEEPIDPFTVTWMSNGSEFTTTQSTGKVTLPASEPAACDGKVFVGWCDQANYSSATTAPTFVQTGDVVSEGAIFYAVFATQDGEGGAEQTTTTTFTSKKWEDSKSAWTSNKDAYGFVANQGVQVTATYAGAGAESKSSFDKVSKVVVSYCTNKSNGAGTIDVTIGSSAKASYPVTKTGGTELRNLEFDFPNTSGKVAFVVNCTTNSIFVNSITITSGGSISYKDYSTTCGGGTDIESVATDQPAAVKIIRDGRLVILRGDAVYTVTGARIQ